MSREELLFVHTVSPQFKNGSSGLEMALIFPTIDSWSFTIGITDF